MFASSTQLKYWTFGDENELHIFRTESNKKYLEKYACGLPEEQKAQDFLTVSEERQLIRHFEYVLKEFCGKFQPPMPKCVVGTAMALFKRFYVHNSAMDYHPRDIMLTCMYLSCKVEEFYVPIGQFVKNLKGDREKFADIVLGFELLLMQKVQYHLTIHNPFRALEGLLIDLKTRNYEYDAEKLRKTADDFLDQSLGTDASLIFSPSQIALSALISSASKEGSHLDSYVTGTILYGSSKADLQKTIYQVKRIRYMVKNQNPLQREIIQSIQKKLEKCRNQENNPESEMKVLSLGERVKVIDMANKGQSSRNIATSMGVGRTQIQQILKRKADILEDFENNMSMDRKRQKRVTGNEEINQLGIIQAFKLQFRSLQLSHVISEMDKKKTLSGSDILKSIDVLSALLWVSKAWKSVEPSTILKCFKRCGFILTEDNGNADPSDDDDDDDCMPLAMLRLSKEIFDCDLNKVHEIDDTVATCDNNVRDWEKPTVELLKDNDSDDSDVDEIAQDVDVKKIDLNEVDSSIVSIKDFSVQNDDFELLEAIMNVQDLINKRRVNSSSKQSCLTDYFIVESRT